MPRDSIFDPEGTQTEHSGNTFMGPRADQDSHMPPDVTDGDVGEAEAADLERAARFKCGMELPADADPLTQIAQAECDRARDAKANPQP